MDNYKIENKIRNEIQNKILQTQTAQQNCITTAHQSYMRNILIENIEIMWFWLVVVSVITGHLYLN